MNILNGKDKGEIKAFFKRPKTFWASDDQINCALFLFKTYKGSSIFEKIRNKFGKPGNCTQKCCNLFKYFRGGEIEETAVVF